MNFSSSIAFAFVVLCGLLFFLIVLQNWPGPFFHDPENNLTHKIQDYDGSWFKVTRAQWEEEQERMKTRDQSFFTRRSKILPGSDQI